MLHVNKFFRYVGIWCEALFLKYLFTALNTRFNVKNEPACTQQGHERPINRPFKLVSAFIKTVEFSEIVNCLLTLEYLKYVLSLVLFNSNAQSQYISV